MVMAMAMMSRQVKEAYDNGEKPLESFREDLQKYLNQKIQISVLPEETDLGIIRLSSTALKQAFAPSPVKCLSAFHELLPQLGRASYSSFIATVR